jgi:hypothetical protein
MPDLPAGYDVRLTVAAPAFDKELKLVADQNGAPRLRLAESPDEPGSAGAAGTLIFDNWHHGLGAEIMDQGDRVIECDGFSTLKPGRVEAIGNRFQLPETGGVNFDTGPVETTRLYATAFQWQGGILFVLPKKLIFYNYPAPEWTTVADAAANRNFRGPAAFYQGQWWFGVEDDTGLSVGHGRYDTDTGTLTVEDQAGDNKASLFHSAHSALWAVELTTVDTKKGQVGWKLKLSTSADPIPATAWEDQTVELFNPFPNAIYQFGRWILVFGADGQVLAISETPPQKTLIPPGVLATDDTEYGVYARQFGEFLVIPHKNGMHAIPFTDNRLRDFHPQNIQGRLLKDVIRPSCLTPFGMDYLVGTRSDADTEKTRILTLRRYPEGISYTQMWHNSLMTGDHAIRAMEVVPATGRIVFLSGNATEGRLDIMNLPPSQGGRPSNLLLGGVQGLTPTAQVVSNYQRTHSGGRAMFTAVRGWAEDYPHVGTFFVRISVDGAPYTNMADIGTTQGAPFRGTLASPIGRTVSLQLNLVQSTDNGTEWAAIILPLLLDYIDEPEGGFRIDMDVLLSTGPRRAGTMAAAWETDLVALQSLQGSTGTLKILERQTSFNVLIEHVSALPIKGRTREASSAAARVVMKVT